MKGSDIRLESFQHEERGRRSEIPLSPNGHPCMCFFNIMTAFKTVEDIEKQGLVAIDTELSRTLFL